MKILSIETSCDETSIALIEKIENRKYKVIAHETISQINLHREFGGVYPYLSRREHEKNLMPLLHKVLKDANLIKLKSQKKSLLSFFKEVSIRDDSYVKDTLGSSIELLERYPDLMENTFDFFSKYELTGKIDYIAVTNGPGLPPALWVGVNFSKVISILLKDFNSPIPIYPINHMEGHIIGGISKRIENNVEIPSLQYPAICLLISGGHTELVLSKEPGKYEKVGETQDDAVGEAYDKVARLLGLPYPGGPEIGKLAQIGREQKVNSLNFPRPMLHTKDLNFSFSGLKTHILYYTQKKNELSMDDKIEISTEFEEAIKDVLVYKTKKAVEEFGAQTVVVGGGVASNSYLRDNFEKLGEELGIELNVSSRELSTDNALMIALTCANQIELGAKPTKEFVAVGSKKYEWK